MHRQKMARRVTNVTINLVLPRASRLAPDQGVRVACAAVASTRAAARGHDRDAAESSLDDLSEEGTVHEPRFGWFKITV